MRAQQATSEGTGHSFGPAVAGIARQLGLKTEQLAGLFSLSPLECARFLAGKAAMDKEDTLVERFAQLADIHRALAKLFEHDLSRMRQWLHLPSESFPNTPLKEMVGVDGLDKVLGRIGELLEARKHANKVVYL